MVLISTVEAASDEVSVETLSGMLMWAVCSHMAWLSASKAYEAGLRFLLLLHEGSNQSYILKASLVWVTLQGNCLTCITSFGLFLRFDLWMDVSWICAPHIVAVGPAAIGTLILIRSHVVWFHLLLNASPSKTEFPCIQFLFQGIESFDEAVIDVPG